MRRGAPARAKSGMTYILIAEDDRDILLLMKRKLELSGYADLWTTSNGLEALEQALQEPPRLVILDVMLPGMDGLSVCAKIKETFGKNAPPILITSARGHTDDLLHGQMAGADAYMIKPFSPRDLLAQVQALIG